MPPLNPTLYNRLQTRVPGGVVRINRPGQRAGVAESVTILGHRRLRFSEIGEQYLVRCPFCADESGHFTVSHLYGIVDSSDNDHLGKIRCLRSNCQNDPDNRRYFYLLVLGGVPLHRRLEVNRTAAPSPATSIQPPDHLIPLSQLPDIHPVTAYLKDRQFDPHELENTWHIAYCSTRSSAQRARGRIYIPVTQNGQLLAYQARLPRDVPKGQKDGPRKYLFSDDAPRSRLLYNLDRALSDPRLVVVCEGPTDVWALGPQGIALFGKTMTFEQEQLLVTRFPAATVVVLLDADDASAASAGREITYRLKRRSTGPVLQAHLPEGLDPGDCPRQELWAYLREFTQQQGVILP